ncbi:hypothetical protein CDUR_12705 [Corynebacterium durum]|mgnify:FL=1|nr:hypothetical protein [Corynebacterium durum]WJY86248.1 hypothetical protein CDUR_12705 [Corynebacterium durum]
MQLQAFVVPNAIDDSFFALYNTGFDSQAR